MIITDQFEINKTERLTSDYVESELASKGIEPLRWAIVAFDGQKYVLDVSYEMPESVLHKDM